MDVRTSHERSGKVPLYCEKKSFSTFTSDVDILVIKEGKVRYIIEIQDSIRPKDIIGIGGAINISTIYADRKETYRLKDVILFIITKQHRKGSKKEEQMRLIEERFKLTAGCLKGFTICTETEFEEIFEDLEHK